MILYHVPTKTVVGTAKEVPDAISAQGEAWKPALETPEEMAFIGPYLFLSCSNGDRGATAIYKMRIPAPGEETSGGWSFESSTVVPLPRIDIVPRAIISDTVIFYEKDHNDNCTSYQCSLRTGQVLNERHVYILDHPLQVCGRYALGTDWVSMNIYDMLAPPGDDVHRGRRSPRCIFRIEKVDYGWWIDSGRFLVRQGQKLWLVDFRTDAGEQGSFKRKRNAKIRSLILPVE